MGVAADSAEGGRGAPVPGRPGPVGLIGLAFYLIGGSVPLAALVTAALVDYVLIFGYEWTHFLIHTAYRPSSRFYRAAWRSHRLHHFKNERFWHGVTEQRL